MADVDGGRERRTTVKICGITNERDALAAIDSGADALGFNLYPHSKRYIELEAARVWLTRLPHSVIKVAVLVNPTAAEAVAIAKSALFDALQLHGQESQDFCRALAGKGIEFI